MTSNCNTIFPFPASLSEDYSGFIKAALGAPFSRILRTFQYDFASKDWKIECIEKFFSCARDEIIAFLKFANSGSFKREIRELN